MKYRKKPVVVEAVQWNGKNATEVLLLAGFDKKNIGDLYDVRL